MSSTSTSTWPEQAGAALRPETATEHFHDCVGRADEVADDGRFQLLYYVRGRLPQDAHLAAVGLLEHLDHPSEGPLVLPRLPVTVDGQPAAPVRGAPRLGEHGAEVLTEAGWSGDEVAALVAAGVVAVPGEHRPSA